MTTTEEVIAEMMRENCGTHMLDSGGAYGRHWQRNRLTQFEKSPEASATFRMRSTGEMDTSFSVSTYHFLTRALDYDEEGNEVLEKLKRASRICKNDKFGELWGLQLMDAFPAFMAKYKNRETWLEARREDGRQGRENYVPTGIYGDGEPMIVNTYNDNCAVDQTLQFLYFEMEGGDYVVLQIHGGADVRGGYSEPRVFTTSSELSIFDFAKGTIYCDENWREGKKSRYMYPSTCGASWSTDDGGYHFYPNDGNTELDVYDAKTGNRGKKGTIVVNSKNEAYCPRCGKGKLRGAL